MVNPDTLASTKQELATLLKSVARQQKGMLAGFGITAGMAVAAGILIPDHAVMSKDELEEGTKLSSLELLLRKSAVPMIVAALLGTPRDAMSVSRLLRTPGIETKVRATAKAMASVPGWYTSYKILKNRYEDKDSNPLNFRETTKGAPVTQLGTLSIGGTVLDAGTTTFKDLITAHGLRQV